MGLVLFDDKPSRTAKKVVNYSFSAFCLFDGYLTEPTSYPQFEQEACLTVYPFNAQGGLGKMWKLFGDKTEEIINELNEALAA